MKLTNARIENLEKRVATISVRGKIMLFPMENKKGIYDYKGKSYTSLDELKEEYKLGDKDEICVISFVDMGE